MGTALAATVLLVEDTALIRHALTRLIQGMGWSVEAVDGGDAAFERLCTARYGCVICDHAMPNGDGLSLVERWPQILDPSTPILIQTSNASDLMREAYGQHDVEVRAKPQLPALLKTWISQAVQDRL